MSKIEIWPIGGAEYQRDDFSNLPEDPKDKKYLTICFVCKDVAKPGQEHLRNYGGIVCYSCRAFWRRSHQNTRKPNFLCKKTDNCVITVATRRRCQKCRYERCLVAGMNPGAVLDEDQKKIRFRKLLLKRQKQLAKQMKNGGKGKVSKVDMCSVGESEESDSIDLDEGSEDVPQLQVYQQPILNKEHLSRIPQSTTESMAEASLRRFLNNGKHFEKQVFQQQPPTPTYSNRYHPYIDPPVAYQPPQPVYQCNPIYLYQKQLEKIIMLQNESLRLNMMPAIRPQPESIDLSTHRNVVTSQPPPLVPIDPQTHFNAKVASITQAYYEVMSNIRCPKTERLMAKLSSIQSGDLDCNFSKKDMQFLILKLSQGFRQFAQTQSEFASLDIADQRKLLCRNSPLFVQLYMGYHLLVEPRHSATESKVEDNKPKKKMWITNFRQNEFLEKFNETTGLFNAGSDLDEYGRLITKLKGLPELTSFEQKAVLAYIIMYDHDEDMEVVSNYDLNDVFDHYIRTCEDCLNLTDLSSVLVNMANFCAYNIEWVDSNQLTDVKHTVEYPHSIPMEYSGY